MATDITQNTYNEQYWLNKLLQKFNADFFELLEQWDQFTAIGALDELVESTRCDVDEELTEADESLLDNIDFTWLAENEKLCTLSSNLNERIERRGAIDLDRDGKGFYKLAIQMMNAKLKSLAKEVTPARP